MDRMIYLDHAATTRPFPETVEAMLPFYGKYYGNASSGYELGEDSKEAIEEARQKIADTMRVQKDTIYFTSGGTESNNWVLRQAAKKAGREGCQIITSRIEHPAVLKTCQDLERQGVEVIYLDVDRQGMVNPAQLRRKISKKTVLVSIMYANNEIGTIQPLREIGRITSRAGVLLHTDAVQAYGHIPVYPDAFYGDFLTASGHKFNGPKGTGFLYIRKRGTLDPWQTGGRQERGMRSGTENVPGIVGLGRSAEISCRNFTERIARLCRLRDHLIRRILKEIPGSILNGHPLRRLPGNVNVSFPGVDGAAVAAMLDLEGICVSSASACSTGSSRPSHVLKAIGRDDRAAYGGVRMTLGEENTKEEIDITVEKLKKAVSYL